MRNEETTGWAEMGNINDEENSHIQVKNRFDLSIDPE